MHTSTDTCLHLCLHLCPHTAVPVKHWKQPEVASWLTECGFEPFIDTFKQHHIVGRMLVHLDDQTLQQMGVQLKPQRMAIMAACEELSLLQHAGVLLNRVLCA